MVVSARGLTIRQICEPIYLANQEEDDFVRFELGQIDTDIKQMGKLIAGQKPSGEVVLRMMAIQMIRGLRRMELRFEDLHKKRKERNHNAGNRRHGNNHIKPKHAKG
jgi:hypothetical protein